MIKNRIAECRAPNAKLIEEPFKFIVIHRTSLSVKEPHNPHPIPDDELDIVKLADAFCRGPMAFYTGGLLPYPFIVRRDGVIEQGLPLDIQGAHARGYNKCSTALAYVGEKDFTYAQFRAITRFCLGQILYSRGARIAGHTSLAGASTDVNKVCPHETFSIPSLVKNTMDMLPANWRQMPRQHIELALKTEGYQLSGLEELTR